MKDLAYPIRIAVSLAIIIFGVIVATMLVRFKKEPAKLDISERPVRVDVVEVHAEDVEVEITGFGQARARDTISIVPEIAGTLVYVHPRLDIGEVIPQGEIIFTIDPRDYQARYDESLAAVQQMEVMVKRLRSQLEIDRDRAKTFQRSRDLALEEYERLKRLYEDDQVGTRSNVDAAEIGYNNARDAADKLDQQVELLPLQIQEAEGALASAAAMSSLSAANLERTEVRAPFDARITDGRLDVGQYVSPGIKVLDLANDSILELSVPLNSRQAREWIRFDERQLSEGRAWFTALEQVPVSIEWTEDPSVDWRGTLVRVERYDEDTRTLSVIVQVSAADAISGNGVGLPLVDGMFCQVRIPGKVARDVYRVPSNAIEFERDAGGYRTAYLAVTDLETSEVRLETRHVLESHIVDDEVFLREGLSDGDLVVTTRLRNPIEGALLDVTADAIPETGS